VAASSEQLQRNKAFLLLRYTLIAATAYLILVENKFSTPPLGVVLAITAALLSNVLATHLPARVSSSSGFGLAVIVADTAWITAALIVLGGTLGAVIGYPGGGSEETQPAVVDGAITAQGRDIYNQSLVRREVFVIQSVVKPGNSGGPLVDLAGHVLGIVFAASSTDPGQAFALTNAEVQPDVQLARGRTAPIATQNYQCAV